MDKVKAEDLHSATIYRSQLGLPTLLTFERTGTAGFEWSPVISQRILDHSELIYVMGGSGRIAVQDRWVEARAHQVFFIPPTVTLDLITQEENKLDLAYFHFYVPQGQYFRRVAGTSSEMLKTIELYDEEAYLNLLVLPDFLQLKHDNPVLRSLMTAFEVYEDKTPGFYQEACCLVLEVLHKLSSALIASVSSPSMEPKGSAAALARRIRSYIGRRVAVFKGMKELGKTFRMNSQYLSRVFKRVYGENIVSYTNNQRINVAKRLLVITRNSVSEIGKSSGFKTTNHFQRVFRNGVGMSPLEFRSRRSVTSITASDFKPSIQQKTGPDQTDNSDS